MSVTTLSVQQQMELLFLPLLQDQQNKLNQLEMIVQNQSERIDRLESKGSLHQPKKSMFQKHSSMDSQFNQPTLKQLNMMLVQRKDKLNIKNPPKSESLKEDTHIYKEIMKNQEFKKRVQPAGSLEMLQKENSNSIQRRLSASPNRALERISLTSQHQSIKKGENKQKIKDIKPLSISMVNQPEKAAVEIQHIRRIQEIITHNSIWKHQSNIKLKNKIIFIRYHTPSNIYVFTTDCVKNIILYIIDIYGSILRKYTLQGHIGPVYSINMNKSNTMVVSASDDKSIGVWKLNQQDDWFRYQTLVGHKSAVISVQFNQVEDILISGGNDNAILIWSKDPQWTLYQILEKHQGLVTSICINIQSNVMASGGCDNSIIIWCKSNEWKYRQTLTGHTKSVLCVNFNQTSKILVSGSRDMTIRLWVKKNGMPYSCIQVINSHTSWVKLVKFQDRILYTGSSDGSIKLFIQQGDGSWYCSQRLQRQEQIVGIEFESSLMIVGSLSHVSYYKDIEC